MKQKLIGVLVFVAILGLIFVTYRSKQTVYNEDDVLGNSSGNLFNGGLFCEYENRIYFSNPEDEGRLYVMDADLSNYEKLSSDTATSINVAGKYIIYGRHNDQQEQSNENVFSTSKTGLYRIDQNGRNLKTLFDGAVNVVNLYGNTVYFQRNIANGFGTSMINIDKSNSADLTEEPIFPYAIDNGSLYYVGVSEDHNIHRMNLSNGQKETIYEGNTAYVTFVNGYLYYLDLKNSHALTRMKADGSDKEVLVTEQTSTYNVTPDGSFLYYEVDNGKNNGIVRMNLKNGVSKTLMDGNYSSIHTTSVFTFFQSFDDGNYYVVQNDDASSPVRFIPETED